MRTIAVTDNQVPGCGVEGETEPHPHLFSLHQHILTFHILTKKVYRHFKLFYIAPQLETPTPIEKNILIFMNQI